MKRLAIPLFLVALLALPVAAQAAICAAPIVLRSEKGSILTWNEGDQNFTQVRLLCNEADAWLTTSTGNGKYILRDGTDGILVGTNALGHQVSIIPYIQNPSGNATQFIVDSEIDGFGIFMQTGNDLAHQTQFQLVPNGLISAITPTYYQIYAGNHLFIINADGTFTYDGSPIQTETSADARYTLLTDPRLTDARTPTAHASTHGAAGSDPVTITPTQAGLGNVTNDAQTKAAIVPNTVPTNGQLLVGDTTTGAYIPRSISGDFTLSNTGVATLATVVTGASCGDGTHTCAITYDSKGRITAVTNTAINFPSSVFGANTQVTFNDNGVMTGVADLTFDKVAKNLTVTTKITTPTYTAPAGSAINITAVAPAQASAPQAGTGVTITTSNAVDGSSTHTAANGGKLTLAPGGGVNGGSQGVLLLPPVLNLGTDTCSGNCPTGARVKLDTTGSFPQLFIQNAVGGNDVQLYLWNLLIPDANGGVNIDGRIGIASNEIIGWTDSVNSANPGNVRVGLMHHMYNGAPDTNIGVAQVGWTGTYNFGKVGDSNVTSYLLIGSTTTASPTEIFSDGASATKRMVLPTNSAWQYTCFAATRRTDTTGDSAAYKVEGFITRDSTAASTTMQANVQTVLYESDPSFDFTMSADTTNGSLKPTATGAAGKTLRWVVNCRTVEVTN